MLIDLQHEKIAFNYFTRKGEEKRQKKKPNEF